MKADSYDKLAHASVIGADVTYIEGGLKESLLKDIHFFDDPDNVDFYGKIKAKFKSTGEDYSFFDQQTVRFGPTDKTDAANHKSTWIMRNGQAKIWATLNYDGSVRIQIHAWDFYNVTPQQDKDGVYNSIAKFLDPLHRMSGGNPNMQTRATL